MLELRGLAKQYRIRGGTVDALHPLSVTFPDTGFFTVCGESGSGKTTLLNLLGLIEKPTSGAIVYNGRRVGGIRGRAADAYRRNVAFVFQDYNLLQGYSVYHNVALPLELAGVESGEIRARVEKALETVGLGGYETRRLGQLSGGQLQRVVVARALVTDAPVILCDEPTGNLDPKTADGIFALLRKCGENRLVITVTHDERLSGKYAQGSLVLGEGSVLENTLPGASAPAPARKASRTRPFARVGHYARLGAYVLRKTWLTAVLGVLAASFCFSVFSLFFTLADYSASSALAETLRESMVYTMPVMGWEEYSRERVDPFSGRTDLIYGVAYQDLTEEDLPALRAAAGEGVDVGTYRCFGLSFASLAETPFDEETLLDLMTEERLYRQFCFSGLVTVGDFSRLHQPLRYGRMPEGAREILIYDYMADNLLYYGILDGEMRDVPGKTLRDRVTGETYVISGVLRSNYEKYAYLAFDGDDSWKEESWDYYYEKYYLATLGCVFATEEFPGTLKTDEMSVHGVHVIFSESQGVPVSVEPTEPAEPVLSWFFDDWEVVDQRVFPVSTMRAVPAEGVSLFAGGEEWGETTGVILTRSQIAAVVGRELTKEELAAMYVGTSDLRLEIRVGVSGITPYADETEWLSLYGVAEDGAVPDGVIYVVGEEAEWLQGYGDGAYQGLSLLLSDDWDVNERVLAGMRMPEEQNRAYYAENVGLERTGYCDDSLFSDVVRLADRYLSSIRSFSEEIMWYALPVVLFLLCVYVYHTVRMNTYEIGLLKALGMNDFAISSVFTASVLLIVLCGLALAIPATFALVAMVNHGFVEAVGNFGFAFFGTGWHLFVGELAAVAVATLVIAAVTYLMLSLRAPARLIRDHKNR